MYQSSGNSPMLIDASEDKPITSELDWMAPYNFIDLEDYGTHESWHSFIGQYDMHCLHPLQNSAIAGTNSIQVSIFASFKDPVVAGMCERSFITPCDADYDASPMRAQGSEQTEKSLKTLIAGVPTRSQDFIDSLESISIGSMISGISSVAEGAYDKPTSVSGVQPVQFDFLSDISNTTGMDYCTKMGTSPSSNLSTSPMYFGGKDNMNLIRIAQTPMLVQVGEFDASDSIGHIITKLECAPNFCHMGTIGEVDYFNPTYLAYASQPFQFWRGSLKYYIRFACSAFLACRVRVGWIPQELVTADFVAMSGEFASKMVSIHGNTDSEVTIPYLQAIEALPVAHFMDVTAGGLGNKQTNGFLQLSLVEAVCTPSSTGASTRIYYSIWVAAGPDFCLTKPRDGACEYQMPWITSEPVPPLPKGKKKMPKKKLRVAVLKSASTSDDDNFEEMRVQMLDIQAHFGKEFSPLIPASYIRSFGRTEGERTIDLRAMMHRYDWVYTTNAGNSIVNYDVFPAPSTLNGSTWNQFLYWSYLFMFWRGSIRYKEFYTAGAQANTTRAHASGFWRLATDNSPHFGNLTQSPGVYDGSVAYHWEYKPYVAFEVPYYDQVPFRQIVPRILDASLTSPVIQNNRSYGAANAASFILVAAGDDFTLGMLSAPPIMTYLV
jgi:hypothetical protein